MPAVSRLELVFRLAPKRHLSPMFAFPSSRFSAVIELQLLFSCAAVCLTVVVSDFFGNGFLRQEINKHCVRALRKVRHRPSSSFRVTVSLGLSMCIAIHTLVF